MSLRALTMALLLASAVLPFLPAGEAQSPSTFAVNVVSARSLGCSAGDEGGPDLRVVVLLNDAPLLVTPIATNRHDPTFGDRADGTAPLPAKLALRVDDEQPADRPGGVATFKACDVGQGAGDWHNLTYHGGAGERIVARGDGPNAAEVVVVIGTGAPPSPSAGVVGVQASSASLMWDRSRGTPAAAYRVALGAVGEDVSLLPADALSATLGGLCDNQPYAVRVLREAPPWLLTSPDVAFTTPNLAPQAPRVLDADPAGERIVATWESATLHDVGRFEVHVGPAAGFTATADTLRGSATGPFSLPATLEVPRREGDAYVRVRTVDVVGVTAVSEPFAIGTAALPPTAPAEDCASVRVDAPGAVAASKPTAPPAETTIAEPGTPAETSPAASTPDASARAITPGATPEAAGSGETPAASKDDEAGSASTPLGPAPALLALAVAAVFLALRRRG